MNIYLPLKTLRSMKTDDMSALFIPITFPIYVTVPGTKEQYNKYFLNENISKI